MSRAPNYYTRKATGEKRTTSEWCELLGITDTEFRRRVARYGLAERTFQPKITKPRRKYPEWDETDRAFLKECVNDPAWRMPDIAKTLERFEEDVRLEMKRLGLINRVTRRPSINWQLVWRMTEEGLMPEATARVLSCHPKTVVAALARMKKMSHTEREQYFKNCWY